MEDRNDNFALFITVMLAVIGLALALFVLQLAFGILIPVIKIGVAVAILVVLYRTIVRRVKTIH